MTSTEERLCTLYRAEDSFTTGLISDGPVKLYHNDRTQFYFLDCRVTNDTNELSYIKSPTDIYYLEIEKSNMLLSSFELRYRKIIHWLYLYDSYFRYNEPKLASLETIEEYWSGQIRQHNFGYYFGYEDIYSYAKARFNCLLDIQELWEPLGLWEFIRLNRIEMIYEDSHKNFDINYNRALMIQNYGRLQSDCLTTNLNTCEYRRTEVRTYDSNFYNRHTENRD